MIPDQLLRPCADNGLCKVRPFVIGKAYIVASHIMGGAKRRRCVGWDLQIIVGEYAMKQIDSVSPCRLRTLPYRCVCRHRRYRPYFGYDLPIMAAQGRVEGIRGQFPKAVYCSKSQEIRISEPIKFAYSIICFVINISGYDILLSIRTVNCMEVRRLCCRCN